MWKKLNCFSTKTIIENDTIDANPFRRSSIFNPLIKHPSSTKIARKTKQTHYKNDHPNMGIALIFNHINVAGQDERRGTVQDKIRISEILEMYGFDVRAYDDLTANQIEDILCKVAEEDHSNNDCFLIVFMSHGKRDFLYTADRTIPAENIWIPFLGENCKTLINKPKLFFFQACRGTQADPGAQYWSDNSNHDQVDSAVVYTIPSTADTLLFYSTVEGYVSFRSKADGSWFIQSISQQLEDFFMAKKPFDIYHLVTSVNRQVAYEYQSHIPTDQVMHDMKAMPNFSSTLTKIFIVKIKPKKKLKKTIC